MADKHFLVNGAMCKCLYGTKTDKLVVTQTKDYINDKDGSEKTIANTKDTKAPFMGKAVAFGNCSKKPNNAPCAVNVTKWDLFYEKITLSNGGKILTEDSTAFCDFAKEQCISVVHHGQTAQVTRAHFDKADITTLAVLNPLSPPVTTDKTKEVPRVKSIEVVFDSRKEKPKFTTTEKNSGKPLKVLARPNEPMTFQVATYHNRSKDNVDTSKVCWKIFNGHDFKKAEGAFDEIGPELKLDYDAPGKYRILAYGNPNANEKSKNDETCCIDLEVRVNALKPELGIDQSLVKRTFKNKKLYYYTKVGQPLEVSAQYEIEPPTDEERKWVRMEVVDSAGNRLQTTSLGEDCIKFTAINKGAVYCVRAIKFPAIRYPWFNIGVKVDDIQGWSVRSSRGSDNIEQQSTLEIETEINSVIRVVSNPAGQFVRPGTSVNFTVTRMDYDMVVMEEFIYSVAIRWKLNDDLLPDHGKKLTLSGDCLEEEDDYVIDAFVDGERKSTHQAECRFTVTKNYVKQIIADTRWIVGKPGQAVALLLMDYDPLDGAIHWQVDDEEKPGAGETLLETFSTPGKHGIVARINDRPCRLEISAEYAKIERWCFMDSRKMYKPKAGWCEALTAVIRSRDAVAETVNLHLLENKNGIHSYVKDLGPITFDKDGAAAITLDTSALQPLLQNTSTGSSYEVCVVMAKKIGSIQFDGLDAIDVDGQPYLFPGASKKSTVTNHETGHYVSLSGEPEVVTVHYLDAQRNRIYKVLKYGEKVEIYVQTRNLAGQKATCTLYQNNVAEQDAVARAAEEFNVGADESLSIDIDTNKLKEVVEEGKRKFLAMFYALLEDPEKDKFWYPEEIARTQEFDTCKANFYQHLKLSEEVGGINKQAATNSFVVLGEALEVASNCECKAYDLIWGNKVSCGFRKKVVQIASNLGLPDEKSEGANWLMAIMAIETIMSFNPALQNKWGFTGLIQIGGPAAETIGTTTDALKKMTAVEQLDCVEKYFNVYKNDKKKLATLTDAYLTVLYPGAAGHGAEKNYIVFDDEAAGEKKTAYWRNSAFYKEPGEEKARGDNNGKTYIWEIEKAIRNIYDIGVNNKAAIKRCAMTVASIPLNAEDVATFRIFSDGAIEKHIPKVVSEEFRNQYRYIYIEQSEEEHVLGTFEYFETVEMHAGNIEGKNKVQLIDARLFKGYSSETVKLKFLTWNGESERWYINPECFAALLGAMASASIYYLGFNGFSDKKAQSVGESKTHRNGLKGDIRYLSIHKDGERVYLQDTFFDYNKQVEFNNALYNFGWGLTEEMYSEQFTLNGVKTLLPHTKHMMKLGDKGYRHYHHLHLTGFDPSSVIIVR